MVTLKIGNTITQYFLIKNMKHENQKPKMQWVEMVNGWKRRRFI